MKKPLTKCTCGYKLFYMDETFTHEAELIKGVLNIDSAKDGESGDVVCQSCDKKYSLEDFKKIIYF